MTCNEAQKKHTRAYVSREIESEREQQKKGAVSEIALAKELRTTKHPFTRTPCAKYNKIQRPTHTVVPRQNRTTIQQDNLIPILKSLQFSLSFIWCSDKLALDCTFSSSRKKKPGSIKTESKLIYRKFKRFDCVFSLDFLCWSNNFFSPVPLSLHSPYHLLWHTGFWLLFVVSERVSTGYVFVFQFVCGNWVVNERVTSNSITHNPSKTRGERERKNFSNWINSYLILDFYTNANNDTQTHEKKKNSRYETII